MAAYERMAWIGIVFAMAYALSLSAGVTVGIASANAAFLEMLVS